MARRGISEAKKHELAVQGARKMVSQGDAVLYRLVELPGDRYGVDGLPGVDVGPVTRRDAPDVLRAAIAAVLEVPPNVFSIDG